MLPFSAALTIFQLPTLFHSALSRSLAPSIQLHWASSTHEHTSTLTQTQRQKQRRTHAHTRTDRHTDTQTRLLKRREKRRVKRAGASRERRGAGYGAMYGMMKYSSVERALRSACIMDLACCVGEFVCATSHMLHVLPCHAAAGYATPAVRPTKRKPVMHVLAKRCKEMHGGPRKTKLTVVFCSVGHTIEATPKRALWRTKDPPQESEVSRKPLKSGQAAVDLHP